MAAVDTEKTEGRRPAAAGSALERIRARRAAAIASKTFDLEVPGMGGVFVRYTVIEFAETERLKKRHAKVRPEHRDLIIAAATLANACVGVGDIDEDGEKVSIDPDSEEWPKFDARLAEILDVPATQGTDIARALYMTDGALLSTSSKLVELSGYDVDAIEEVERGN